MMQMIVYVPTYYMNAIYFVYGMYVFIVAPNSVPVTHQTTFCAIVIKAVQRGQNVGSKLHEISNNDFKTLYVLR